MEPLHFAVGLGPSGPSTTLSPGVVTLPDALCIPTAAARADSIGRRNTSSRRC